MWLFTTSGFYSIVEKPWDRAAGTLTVRARVAADLDRLRSGALPALGPTVQDPTADYRFRAQAPREAVARAVAQAVTDLDYDNFKSAVGKAQGHARAHIYHDVWAAALKLQTG
jgi:hypothetical protein